MTIKETVESLLKLAEILTAWPVVLLFIILLFRQQISAFLPDLARRLSKADFGTSKFEFSTIALDALQETLLKGAEAYKDYPDQLASFVRDQTRKLSGAQASPVNSTLSLYQRVILWVDDQPLNSAYETGILERLGATVVFARSAEEALALLGHQRVDVLVSKDSLNGDTAAGYDLLEKAKRKANKLPFLFYTSNVEHLDRERSRAAYGVADLPNQLITLVMNALHAR